MGRRKATLKELEPFFQEGERLILELLIVALAKYGYRRLEGYRVGTAHEQHHIAEVRPGQAVFFKVSRTGNPGKVQITFRGFGKELSRVLILTPEAANLLLKEEIT